MAKKAKKKLAKAARRKVWHKSNEPPENLEDMAWEFQSAVLKTLAESAAAKARKKRK